MGNSGHRWLARVITANLFHSLGGGKFLDDGGWLKIYGDGVVGYGCFKDGYPVNCEHGCFNFFSCNIYYHDIWGCSF